jgi:hypothetical protein
MESWSPRDLLHCMGWQSRREQELEDEPAPKLSESKRPFPVPKRVVTPSFATLERAVSATIFFENIYFPLRRDPPSLELRQLAMENDILSMGLSDRRKEDIGARCRQNKIATVNSVGKSMSLHLSNYRRLVMVSVLLCHKEKL